MTVLSFDRRAGDEFRGEPFRVVRRAPPPWRGVELFLYWQDYVRAATHEYIEHEGEPDVLIATTSTLTAFDVVSSDTKRIAVIQAFENFGFSCPWVPIKTRLKLLKGAIIRRFRDRYLLNRADVVVTNSGFMRDAIINRFGLQRDRVRVLTQLIDFVPVFTPAPKNVVGFVHRGADKNIDFVLGLAQKAPDLTFLIYGHVEGVPGMLPPNVILKGWAVDRAAMFASAALWIVPSKWAEPLGRVAIEAQVANRAVLVARRGGLPETVGDDLYVLDGFQSDQWLQRMRLLLAMSQEKIEAIGARVRSVYSKNNHDQGIDSMIEALVCVR